MIPQSQLRIDAKDWPAAQVQLNAILAQLQAGALLLRGVKLDVSATTAPTGAPGPGDPNIRAANIAGTWTYYHWTGAAWVAF